jgi:class 3 adenylate cyclase
MESNHRSYNFETSKARIDEILNTKDNSYEELKSIPSRDKLTYTNGFYVNCTALFVDIRGSSQLPKRYRRPTLARIYRSYLSEVIAIMNANSCCSEVNIQGDCVWGIFNTINRLNIDTVFVTAARISSIVDVINLKLKERKIDPIKIGIGMDYGRALMIKSGYNGSGINEVVWMGDVVNNACNLCGYGNKEDYDCKIMVSQAIYNNLSKHNQSLLTPHLYRQCFHGNVINPEINKWVESQNNYKPIFLLSDFYG